MSSNRFGPANEAYTKLVLDRDRRIVRPSGEPVLGFPADRLGAPSARLVALTFPHELLLPQLTTEIAYGCNLPFSLVPPLCKDGVLDKHGGLASDITSEAEPSFLNYSLPGGQTDIIGASGARHNLAFRWACVSQDAIIGAIWRCYIRMRSGARRGNWTAIEYNFVFDKRGVLLTPSPSPIRAKVNAINPIDIHYFPSRITQFPCALQRVKVTLLRADGRAKRAVADIRLLHDGRVVAYFSDGSSDVFATSPSQTGKISRAA